MEKVFNSIVGGTGLGTVQLASMIDPSDIGEIGKLLIQIAIAAVTIFSILRKKKE